MLEQSKKAEQQAQAKVSMKKDRLKEFEFKGESIIGEIHLPANVIGPKPDEKSESQKSAAQIEVVYETSPGFNIENILDQQTGSAKLAESIDYRANSFDDKDELQMGLGFKENILG